MQAHWKRMQQITFLANDRDRNRYFVSSACCVLVALTNWFDRNDESCWVCASQQLVNLNVSKTKNKNDFSMAYTSCTKTKLFWMHSNLINSKCESLAIWNALRHFSLFSIRWVLFSTIMQIQRLLVGFSHLLAMLIISRNNKCVNDSCAVSLKCYSGEWGRYSALKPEVN